MLARFLKASSTNLDTTGTGYDGYDRQDWRGYNRTTGTGYGTSTSGTSGYGSSYGTGATTGVGTAGTTSYGAGTENRSSYTPERRDPDQDLNTTGTAGTSSFNEPTGR